MLALSSARSSNLLISPLAKNNNRSAVSLIKSRLCSIIRMVLPCSLRPFNRVAICSLFLGLIPAAGSSNKSNSASFATQHARFNNFCWPKLISRAGALSTSCKKYSVDIFSAWLSNFLVSFLNSEVGSRAFTQLSVGSFRMASNKFSLTVNLDISRKS